MSVIDITRSHSLNHAQAVEAADSLAKDLSQRFEVDHHWEGDVLHFSRSGVKGHLSINPNIIHVHIELGMLLRPLKGRVEDEIHRHLDSLTRA